MYWSGACGRSCLRPAKMSVTPFVSGAPFEIRYQNGQGPKIISADAIIDSSGTWHSPNPAGANGLPAIGEPQSAARIAYGMPDVLGKQRSRYAGRTVAVLGAGHSAIG